jgi:hypothetical protein
MQLFMVKKILGISFLFALGVVTFCFFRVSFSQTKNTATENTPVKTVLYTGEISHIYTRYTKSTNLVLFQKKTYTYRQVKSL